MKSNMEYLACDVRGRESWKGRSYSFHGVVALDFHYIRSLTVFFAERRKGDAYGRSARFRMAAR